MPAAKKIRTYSELIQLSTFEDRYNYLKLSDKIGVPTFGYDRIFNQRFYTSRVWLETRDKIILRDNACDLGMQGRDIFGRVIIHHMNPLLLDDIRDHTEFLLNPEYLICVSHATHNAIHFGDPKRIPQEPVVRKPNDMCPWK